MLEEFEFHDEEPTAKAVDEIEATWAAVTGIDAAEQWAQVKRSCDFNRDRRHQIINYLKVLAPLGSNEVSFTNPREVMEARFAALSTGRSGILSDALHVTKLGKTFVDEVETDGALREHAEGV